MESLTNDHWELLKPTDHCNFVVVMCRSPANVLTWNLKLYKLVSIVMGSIFMRLSGIK